MAIKQFIKKFSFLNNFNNYPDGVIVLNYLNEITYWNRKAQSIFDYPEEEMIGRNIAILFDSEADKVYSAIETGKTYVLSAKSKTDKELFIEISCKDIKKQEKILITVRDVTKNQKVLEKLLLEYEKASKVCKHKSSFIAGLSGELKTPLHSILGFSQGMLDGICGELNEKQEKYVSIVNKNALQLLDYIDTLLEMSSLESSIVQPNLKVFDVVKFTKAQTDRFQDDARKKGIQLETDLSDIVKRNIYSDEKLLEKVLCNIIDNAIKFTEIGTIRLKGLHPEIETVKTLGLEVTPESDSQAFLMFSVTDTGIGISQEEIPVIFDEYEQTDRTVAKKYGGTGLKLPLIKKIIDLLKGAIWVESEIGQGSTFSFIIPIERDLAG